VGLLASSDASTWATPHQRWRIFNLRFAGDFQNDRIAIDTVDGAVDAAVGDTLSPDLSSASMAWTFLRLALLRHDHHRNTVTGEHETERDQEAAKAPPPVACNRIAAIISFLV